MGDSVEALELLKAAVRSAKIAPGARLLLAVSGGPDSMALLHVFANLALQEETGWQLRVGHVHHGLREPDADLDEDLVREEAAGLGLPVDIARVNTQEYARRQRLSIEAAARVLRYQALEDMLRTWPGDTIVTGHTQDDQAETVVLRLLRGTGQTGLAAMHSARGHLIRPFLTVTRDQIVAIVEARRIAWRQDATNLDPNFSRNRVRAEVMPTLRNLAPDINAKLGRTAALARRDSSFLREESRRALTSLGRPTAMPGTALSLTGCRLLHPALLSAMLRLAIEQCAGGLADVDERHIRDIQDAISSPDAQVVDRLPHALQVYREGNALVLCQGQLPTTKHVETFTLAVPGQIKVPGGFLSAHHCECLEPSETSRRIVVCGPNHALCASEALGTSLTVRGWRAGDRISPPGMEGSRKLQDVFVDRKVPRRGRAEMVVVENEKHIVWVPGIMLDRRVRVHPDSPDYTHLVFQRDG